MYKPLSLCEMPTKWNQVCSAKKRRLRQTGFKNVDQTETGITASDPRGDIHSSQAVFTRLKKHSGCNEAAEELCDDKRCGCKLMGHLGKSDTWNYLINVLVCEDGLPGCPQQGTPSGGTRAVPGQGEGSQNTFGWTRNKWGAKISWKYEFMLKKVLNSVEKTWILTKPI